MYVTRQKGTAFRFGCADFFTGWLLRVWRQELRQTTAHQESAIADLNTEIAAYENRVMELKRTLEATAHACRTHENELVQKRAAIELLEREKSQVRIVHVQSFVCPTLPSRVSCCWMWQIAAERDQLLDRLAHQEAAAQKQAELIQFINKLSAEASSKS